MSKKINTILSHNKRLSNENDESSEMEDAKKLRSANDDATKPERPPLMPVTHIHGRLSRRYYKRADGRDWDDVPTFSGNTSIGGAGGGAENYVTTASNEMSIPEDPQNPAVTSDTPADVDNDHEWEDYDVSLDNETEEPSELDVDDIVHDMTLNEWKVVEATQIIKRFVEKISSRVTTKQKNVSHGVVKKELNKILEVFSATEIENKMPLEDYIENIPTPANTELDGAVVKLERRFELRNNKSTSVQCPKTGCNKKFDKLYNAKRHYITIHLRLKLWRCIKCLKTFTRYKNLAHHVKSVHLDIVRTCGVCQTTGSEWTIQKHDMWGHYCPTGENVLFSPTEGKIEYRLFIIDYVTVGYGYTWNVFKVNWVNEMNEPVKLSVGISRFLDLEKVMNEFLRTLLHAMANPEKYARWVSSCGSARKLIRAGLRLDCSSATSLGIPSVSKSVATQAKGVARQHYGASFIIATHESKLYLINEMPNIEEQLDSFLEELPPDNKKFVLDSRRKN